MEDYHIEEERLYRWFKKYHPEVEIPLFKSTYKAVEWLWKKQIQLELKDKKEE